MTVVWRGSAPGNARQGRSRRRSRARDARLFLRVFRHYWRQGPRPFLAWIDATGPDRVIAELNKAVESLDCRVACRALLLVSETLLFGHVGAR